jgi:hypothetical protein
MSSNPKLAATSGSHWLTPSRQRRRRPSLDPIPPELFASSSASDSTAGHPNPKPRPTRCACSWPRPISPERRIGLFVVPQRDPVCLQVQDRRATRARGPNRRPLGILAVDGSRRGGLTVQDQHCGVRRRSAGIVRRGPGALPD